MSNLIDVSSLSHRSRDRVRDLGEVVVFNIKLSSL